MSRPRGTVFLDVDGESIRLCGVATDLSEDERAALVEIIRAAQRNLAETPLSPEQDARQLHRQCGRPDGTWGCRCGWIQDKPHREHVADMVAAARDAARDET